LVENRLKDNTHHQKKNHVGSQQMTAIPECSLQK